MAWNKCLSWHSVEMKGWTGTKWRLGHFRMMLTSKLATAGRPGTINSHNKKVAADHVASAMQTARPSVPKARPTITYNWARHKRYRHRERFNFPRQRGPVTSNWLLVTNSACHRSILHSLGEPCQLESCAAGKRTSGSTVVCVEYKRPGAACLIKENKQGHFRLVKPC